MPEYAIAEEGFPPKTDQDLRRPVFVLTVVTASMLLATLPLAGLTWFTAIKMLTFGLAVVINIVLLVRKAPKWVPLMIPVLVLMQPFISLPTDRGFHVFSAITSGVVLVLVGVLARSPRRPRRARRGTKSVGNASKGENYAQNAQTTDGRTERS